MLVFLKILFVVIVAVHGLIHLMGFAKAFKFAELEQLTQPISKPFGLLWLTATVLFLVTIPIYLMKKDWWWIAALASVIVSQVVIVLSWQDAKFGTIANVIILIAVVLGYGQWSFSSWYRNEAEVGLAQTANMPAPVLTETDLEPLPELVKKYLRYTGAIGKPKVNNFKVKFAGKLRQNEESEWMQFTSEQYNFQESATRLFFMNAVMKTLPVAGFLNKFDS